MRQLLAALSIVSIAAWSDAALPASPDARTAYDKEVISACVQASGLSNARPAGDAADFDDRVGYTALVIQGRYPQPHMKNQTGRVLCLFEKRSKTPYVVPADAMIRPVKQRSDQTEASSPVGTRWKLTQLGNEAITVSDNQREPYLVFQDKAERVTGFGGCNRLTGTYKLDKDSLALGRLGGTRMACASGSETEAKFLAALERVQYWKITRQHLDLLDSSRTVIAQFEARDLK